PRIPPAAAPAFGPGGKVRRSCRRRGRLARGAPASAHSSTPSTFPTHDGGRRSGATPDSAGLDRVQPEVPSDWPLAVAVQADPVLEPTIPISGLEALGYCDSRGLSFLRVRGGHVSDVGDVVLLVPLHPRKGNFGTGSPKDVDHCRG